MIVNLDFALNAWVRKIQIGANSVEEAQHKLESMTLREILEDDSLVLDGEFVIKDVSTEIEERDVTVKVNSVTYDLDSEANSEVIKYLNTFLDNHRTLTIHNVNIEDDLDDMVRDLLEYRLDQEILSVDYEIVSEN